MKDMVPHNIQPGDIPEGFKIKDPTRSNRKNKGDLQNDSQKRQEEMRIMLEQAMTPKALARLGTIKVISHSVLFGKKYLDISLKG